MLSIRYDVKGLDFLGLVGNCKCSVWDRVHGTVNSQSAVKNKRIKVQTSKQAGNLRRYYWNLAVKEIAHVLIHEMPAASYTYIYNNYNIMTVNSYNIQSDV